MRVINSAVNSAQRGHQKKLFQHIYRENMIALQLIERFVERFLYVESSSV